MWIFTCGYWLANCRVCGGNSWRPTLSTAAKRRSPLTTSRSSRSRSSNPSTTPSTSRAAPRKTRPSGVSEKFFLPRSISLTENRASSALTCWLTALCVTPLSSAAWEKLAVSARSRNTLKSDVCMAKYQAH